MNDESRHLDLTKQIGHVHRRTRFEQPRGHVAGAGPAAELVVPADLRLAGAGQEARREDLAEDRVLLAPADPYQLHHGAVLALALRIAPHRPAAGIAAVENQTRDAFRMT